MICLDRSSRHSEMSDHVKLVASKKDEVVFFILNKNRKTYANVLNMCKLRCSVLVIKGKNQS